MRLNYVLNYLLSKLNRKYINWSEGNNKNKENLKKGIIAVSIIGVLSTPFWAPFWPTIINTSEAGVKTKLGKIQEQSLEEGLHFYNPLLDDVDKIDLRERVETVPTTTVSKEGLKFGVTITVRYRVKDGAAVELKKGLKTPLHELVRIYTNSTIDDVATAKDKNHMYSDNGRVAIVKAVKDKLNAELSKYADIQKVVLEDIKLPDSITKAIEAQQAAEELIVQKGKEVEVARKSAEIRVTEAQGIADANRIIQKSLTKEYLTYEALQKLNPNVNTVFVGTEGVTPIIDLKK